MQHVVLLSQPLSQNALVALSAAYGLRSVHTHPADRLRSADTASVAAGHSVTGGGATCSHSNTCSSSDAHGCALVRAGQFAFDP